MVAYAGEFKSPSVGTRKRDSVRGFSPDGPICKLGWAHSSSDEVSEEDEDEPDEESQDDSDSRLGVSSRMETPSMGTPPMVRI